MTTIWEYLFLGWAIQVGVIFAICAVIYGLMAIEKVAGWFD